MSVLSILCYVFNGVLSVIGAGTVGKWAANWQIRRELRREGISEEKISDYLRGT